MTKQEAIDKIKDAIKAVQVLERSRETSIAVTHLETAMLWVREVKPDVQS